MLTASEVSEDVPGVLFLFPSHLLFLWVGSCVGLALPSYQWDGFQLYCLTTQRAVDLEELSFRNPSTSPESHFEVPTLDGVCLWGLLPE